MIERYNIGGDGATRFDPEGKYVRFDEITGLIDALRAADQILRYMPDISTNNNGTARVMTTRLAQRMVREAVESIPVAEEEPA